MPNSDNHHHHNHHHHNMPKKTTTNSTVWGREISGSSHEHQPKPAAATTTTTTTATIITITSGQRRRRRAGDNILNCNNIYNYHHHYTRLAIVAIFIITSIALPARGLECNQDSDCDDRYKICYNEKCICTKLRPVEDVVNNKCLELKEIGHNCSFQEQCLGYSKCLQGVCSCGDGVKIYNPSTNIDYCHQKKKLYQECNNDLQCTKNAYCSQDKLGCLCANGYAPNDDVCLPKTCQNTTDCESEYHRCEENLCMCQPANFDVTTAKCYKFGSRGGKGSLDEDGDTNFIEDFINDLTSSDGDNFWIILLIIIISILLILSLLVLLFKKHYLRYCFTSYKKEYEPNNKSAPKNGFHSNPINNKSFKRKYDTDSAPTNNLDRTRQSADQLRKVSDVDVNLDINDSDEHEVMISGKIKKPLVTSTATTV